MDDNSKFCLVQLKMKKIVGRVPDAVISTSSTNHLLDGHAYVR